MNPKIITLMQFARKAGRLIHGYDANCRALNQHLIGLLIVAEDVSERSKTALNRINSGQVNPVRTICTGSKQELSYALGLPVSGIFGISDKNLAAKIVEYWQAEHSGGTLADTSS